MKAKNSASNSVKIPKKLKNNLTTTVKRQHKATKKHIKRHFHTIVPVFVLLLVVGVLVSSKYYRTENMQGDTLSVRIFNPDSSISVDEVTSTNVAKIIANDTDMIVAGNVNNLASNVEAKVKLSISEQSYVAKPQIVMTDAPTRDDKIEYVVKEGDTVVNIAEKFGIKSETIRWENDLAGDSVAAGTKLTILPVDGLTYTIKEGDTAASLADKYSADADKIISFNDAEVSGLKTGEDIIIPGGEKPAPPAPRYFSTVNTASSFSSTTITPNFSYGSTPVYAGNTYVWGNCTWWVYNRRAELGRPIPSNLGNANQWNITAAAAGMSVSTTPVPGSIIYHINDPWSYLGHVGIVETVNSDGSIVTSDMNYNFQLGIVINRNIPASDFPGRYLFLN